MSYKIEFTKEALLHISKIIKSGNKLDANKLDLLIEELKTHPTLGTGNPEKLKHHLSGYWSRRLNKKDHLIYQIIEEPDNLVVVVSALGHY